MEVDCSDQAHPAWQTPLMPTLVLTTNVSMSVPDERTHDQRTALGNIADELMVHLQVNERLPPRTSERG